jgi:hypothetical protein
LIFRDGAKSVDKSKKFDPPTEEWSILRCGTALAQPASVSDAKRASLLDFAPAIFDTISKMTTGAN